MMLVDEPMAAPFPRGRRGSVDWAEAWSYEGTSSKLQAKIKLHVKAKVKTYVDGHDDDDN